MANDTPVLTEAELRDLVPLDLALVDTVEKAFIALSESRVVMPPVMSMDLPKVHGEVDVKTAWIEGFDSFAIKISTGFFDNPKLGFASLSGLMVLHSARTGHVDALLVDNGLLTDLRTAAAGAVAARALSRADAATVAVLGTGMQARLQLQAICLVRPISTAFIWGRDEEKALVLARGMSEKLGIDAHRAATIEDAVARADIAITTTPARTPLIAEEMIHPGLHITAMGSDQPGKTEVAPGVLRQANRLVCDTIAQSRAMGELYAAEQKGVPAEELGPVELGAVLTGQVQGRTTDSDVTVCDLTGTGVQDTAIASLAFQRWQ